MLPSVKPLPGCVAVPSVNPPVVLAALPRVRPDDGWVVVPNERPPVGGTVDVPRPKPNQNQIEIFR